MSDIPLTRGEIPFPEAGEGIVLRFTNSDLSAIQKQFGPEWFNETFARLNRTDVDFIKFCYERGCKTFDGKYANLKFDNSPVPVAALSNPILDGLFMAVLGRTFDEHLKMMEKKAELARLDAAATEDDDSKNK